MLFVVVILHRNIHNYSWAGFKVPVIDLPHIPNVIIQSFTVEIKLLISYLTQRVTESFIKPMESITLCYYVHRGIKEKRAYCSCNTEK